MPTEVGSFPELRPRRAARPASGERKGGFHFGEPQKRTFRKGFLALSRDVGTVRVHRDSTALFCCKSGTGPRPVITSVSPSIVVVIAALYYIMCSMPRDNDGAREDCGRVHDLI